MRFWFRKDKGAKRDREESPPQAAAEPATAEAQEAAKKVTFLRKISNGLRKTNEVLNTPVEDLIRRSPKISRETLESLEEVLIRADIGPAMSLAIVDAARAKLKKGELDSGEKLRDLIKKEILFTLKEAERSQENRPGGSPRVVLVIGVNGNGKTTTIGKLSHAYRQEGASVVLAAADTFRAAATEQLRIWGERAGVPVVSRDGRSDPASVVFDAIRKCREEHADYLLIDTAGRLQTKRPLMDELQKISRVAGREVPGAPHEVLLVIDATTGQNGVHQAREFTRAVPVTGIALTKLDGTAKGGIVVATAREFKIPIRYVGVGEQMDDLVPFDPVAFTDSLLRT